MFSDELLLEKIVNALKPVDGIQAIVLGGSRARGTHTSSSDFDIGLYYDPSHPLDLNHLKRVAADLDVDHRANLVTPPGGWGPWINGGGWLKIENVPVDFLYRDLEKISRVVADCLNGQVEMVYQPGHPFGFVTSIYLAELAVCQPLWDPAFEVANLKTKVSPYPPALKQALVQKFFWEADFSIQIAYKAADRFDLPYVSGCCFRSVNCLLQTLFALNETHWLNEKGELKAADQFVQKPARLKERVEAVFKKLVLGPEQAHQALSDLAALAAETGALLS